MFRVLLSSECDDSVRAESVPVPFSQKSDFYCWSPSRLALDGFDLGYNQLVFQFVLEYNLGRILVRTIHVPTGRLNYHRQVIPERKSSMRQEALLRESLEQIRPTTRSVLQVDGVEITYTAYKYTDLEDSVTPLGQIYVDAISFTGRVTLPENGHKLTCLVNATIYLGRVQTCTLFEDSCRLLTWKQGSRSAWAEKDFDQIKEEAQDLAFIRRADPSGTARSASPVKRETHVPDNEAFSNPVCKLPIYLNQGDSLRVQFFNFKFMPPRSVETVFKWGEFEKDGWLKLPVEVTPRGLFRRKAPAGPPEAAQLAPLGVAQRHLLRGMFVRVVFSLEASRAAILSIRLHSDEKALDMEEIQVSRTV